MQDRDFGVRYYICPECEKRFAICSWQDCKEWVYKISVSVPKPQLLRYCSYTCWQQALKKREAEKLERRHQAIMRRAFYEKRLSKERYQRLKEGNDGRKEV